MVSLAPVIESLAGWRDPGIDILRLDQLHGAVSGNKWYKLQGHLEAARQRGAATLVSLGGPWSNHLHALAALGQQVGVSTVGLVRGDGQDSTAMLEDAKRWGMTIQFVGYGAYRRRYDPQWQADCLAAFPSAYLIPEGGAGELGLRGCADIARWIPQGVYHRVMLACGSGTTLAGLASALPVTTEVVGVSPLKQTAQMERDIAAALAGSPAAPWRVDKRFYLGGFGRLSPELVEFVLDFEADQGIPLDPVYTAKLCYAAAAMHRTGELAGWGRVLLVHTGGLQGRRGFPAVFGD